MSTSKITLSPDDLPKDIPYVVHYHTLSTRSGQRVVVASSKTHLDCSNLEKVVVTSGGFDTYHAGHIACINQAAERGPVVVIVNSDGFLKEKRKSEATLPDHLESIEERLIKMANLPNVAFAIESIDDDQTVCETIRLLTEVSDLTVGWFANGGDRKRGNVPEEAVCQEHDIEMWWGCGGEIKLNNSSVILRRAVAHAAQNLIGLYHETDWGGWINMDATEITLHKTLVFEQEKGVSLQLHHRREEKWLCLEGQGWLYLGALDEENRQRFSSDGRPVFGTRVWLEPGETAEICCGQAHMNENAGTGVMMVHETWTHTDPENPSNEEDIDKWGAPFTNEEDRERCRDWLHPEPNVLVAE